MKNQILSLSILTILASSCSSILVDTTMAPPPIAAQKGDFHVDGGVGLIPQVSSSDPGGEAVALLGFGYMLSDFDHLYLSGAYGLDAADSSFRVTTSVRYLRKLNRSGSFEHFVGGQLQYGNTTDLVNKVGYNGTGLGLTYIIRTNTSSLIQPYGGLQTGYGLDPETLGDHNMVGTVTLGLQYRPWRNFEFKFEMNQNALYSFDTELAYNTGGLSLQARYIF
ncbi:MAG: hypothetical protein EP346_01330 [Bacteroidetes bacterium]|nr:MAG: hypothetical protein EP346_01330 [Bacteroidota bacterium]